MVNLVRKDLLARPTAAPVKLPDGRTFRPFQSVGLVDKGNVTRKATVETPGEDGYNRLYRMIVEMREQITQLQTQMKKTRNEFVTAEDVANVLSSTFPTNEEVAAILNELRAGA